MIIGVADLNGQNRADLEAKKKRLLEDIQMTSNRLQQTRNTKEKTYDHLLTLKADISKREELIATMEEELEWVGYRIDRNQSVIDALADDLKRLRLEYGEMLRQGLRYKLNYSSLLLVFSADNLNQAFRRWRYLQQYNEYRKRQARMIRLTSESLENRALELEEQYEKQEVLLKEVIDEQNALAASLKEKDAVLKDLTKNEAQLRQDLIAQENTRKALDNAIEELIRKEMAAAEARKKAAGRINESPRKVALSSDFRQNKGKLPWPVKRGVITGKYGKQQHPTLRSIVIKNNGIDILTEDKALVSSIFNGTVTGMQVIPGYKQVLIIQHGKYYSVYSNLEEVYVRRGDEVKTGAVIGRVGDKRNGSQGNLHFEIWEEKERMDPGAWILKN